MLTTLNNFQTENIFSIEREEDLKQSFRPRDQKKLIIPSNFEFPMNVRSYLAWKESSGVYTFLVFKKPNWDLPRGVVFKRMGRGGHEAPTGGLCGWCHAYGSSDEIGMLSVTVNSKISFSYILCQELNCIEKIEEAAGLSGKNPEKAIHQLYHRMGLFYEGLSDHNPE